MTTLPTFQIRAAAVLLALTGSAAALATSAWAQEHAKDVNETFARGIRIEGNEAVSARDLQRALEPFAGGGLTRARLDEAVNAATLVYVNRGYLNSGARLAGVDPATGVATLRITEGQLTEVTVTGNRWYRADYLRDRLRRGAGEPLNTNGLNDALDRLRRNTANVRSISADLQPGARPGEATLAVNVQERPPFIAALRVDNRRPAGVGAEELLLELADTNLTGVDDTLELTYGIAQRTRHGARFSGPDNLSVSYTRPVTPWDTTLSFSYARADYSVVEAPFDRLDIESAQRVYSGTIRQPVYRTRNREAAVSLTVSKEESQTDLLGVPFTLSPGAVNGEANVFVLRFAQEYTQQGAGDILALRSTFNFGLNAFGATDNGTDRDGEFFVWRGQAQYVRRLFNTDNLLVLRLNGQVANDSLLALEQFSIGGALSVRGYRENQLVRDSGIFGSAEVRFPVLSRGPGDPILQVAPFFDAGAGFNHEESSAPKPRSLYSIGVGLLLTLRPYLTTEVYYGYGLKELDQSSDNDLQDHGVHFLLRFQGFGPDR